jgi:SdrD B-like domain/Protein of unknown function (DUF3048) C-terminal domain
MKLKLMVLIIVLFLSSCNSNLATQETSSVEPVSTTDITATVSITPVEPQPTPTLQPSSSQANLGPDEFPPAHNPLTGRRVADPALLDLPALLVSVSHFPPTVRPQGGLSFAPFVYEFTITEGATRHLALFYGEFPEPEIPLRGDCEIRSEPFLPKKEVLGNRVWYDTDQNGLQNPGENGIGGICVNLYDDGHRLLQETTTDSNGYYAFDVEPGRYLVEFLKPSGLEFTQKNAGNDDQDSDVDQVTGQTGLLEIPTSHRLLDAGMVPSGNLTPTPDPSVELPAEQIGPVRSGRMHYAHLSGFYQDNCLIYASASAEVLAQIPGPCATVARGAMLDIDRMKQIAQQNGENSRDFNYASNLYSNEPPPGGKPALEIREFWAFLNQSKWEYDAAGQAWWRYVDDATPATAGEFHPEADRLNGRQLMFENIILLFAEHTVIEPTIVDIGLQAGQIGKAFLFRDGQVYEIRWSTRAGEYEQMTGLRRPIQFQNLDGSPAALRPGKTWVVLFPLQAYLEGLPFAIWRARFVAPEGTQ